MNFLSALRSAAVLTTVAAASVSHSASVMVPETTGRGVELEIGTTLEGVPADQPPARAWLAVRDGILRVEFEVEGNGESALLTPRDSITMFEGPAVEFFLGSGGTASEGYYHFCTNPAGAIYDEAVRDGGWTRDPLWDAPMTATPLPPERENTWRVAMEIPLAVLRRPRPDAPPRELPAELWMQAGAAAFPAGSPPVAASWAPTNSSFHTPQDFGRLHFVDGPPRFPAAITTAVEQTDSEVIIRTSLPQAPDGAEFRATGFLRHEEGEDIRTDLFAISKESAETTGIHRIPLSEAKQARYLVTRVYDQQNNLQDQLVQDWFLSEDSPVLVIHERFRDTLHLRVNSSEAAPVRELSVHDARDGAEPVWSVEPETGSHEYRIDATDWNTGLYQLTWTSVQGEPHSVPLLRIPDTTHGVPRGWAFWGYHPDEELLAEFRAFGELTQTDQPMAAYIYGGSLDPETAALSALDLSSLRAWSQALPDAQFHLMIDGYGNFDLLTEEQIDGVARKLVQELMPASEVDGLHLDLEPYRASQVRLTRALTRHGWKKTLSMATGLATTIPPEQWASIDYMVVMNYDLGKTPEIFQARASENARAFAQAAARNQSDVLIGIPVIATHNEYGMVVEAESGEVVEGGRRETMMPFVEPALQIVKDLSEDPELGPHVGAPVLWGALARGHHVGQRAYRYFPTTITGDVWTRLLEFDEEKRP